MNGSADALLDENADVWLKRWSQGRITLATEDYDVLASGLSEPPRTSNANGEFYLSCCLIAAQYALLSNFPDYTAAPLIIPSLDDPEHSKMCAFFGVSPSGLGRGHTGDDYMVGHSMTAWLCKFKESAVLI